MSSSPETNTARGLLGNIGRPLLLVSGLTVFLLLVAVACGGGDDDSQPPSRNTVDVVMSTFTPTSEADAANRQATRDAQETEVAATATYAAENPPSPTPTRDPNATMVPQPTIDPDEEGLRPPFTWLSDGSDQMPGVFGNFGFVDLETGTVASVQAPFYDVGDDGLTVGPGEELQFILQEDVVMPSAMTGDPSGVSVEIYTWDDNNAIPMGTDGSVGSRPWFVPGVAPVAAMQLDLDAPWIAMPDEPDRYVVRVEVTWPTGSQEDNPPQERIFAVYAFTVYVQ